MQVCLELSLFDSKASANELGRPYNDLFPIESLMVKNATWTADKSYLYRYRTVLKNLKNVDGQMCGLDLLEQQHTITMTYRNYC